MKMLMGSEPVRRREMLGRGKIKRTKMYLLNPFGILWKLMIPFDQMITMNIKFGGKKSVSSAENAWRKDGAGRKENVLAGVEATLTVSIRTRKTKGDRAKLVVMTNNTMTAGLGRMIAVIVIVTMTGAWIPHLYLWIVNSLAKKLISGV